MSSNRVLAEIQNPQMEVPVHFSSHVFESARLSFSGQLSRGHNNQAKQLAAFNTSTTESDSGTPPR